MIRGFLALGSPIVRWRRPCINIFTSQIRNKRYIPLYLPIVKRKPKKVTRVVADTSKESNAALDPKSETPGHRTITKTLSTPEDAIEVLRSIHVSNFNNGINQLLLRVWTRVDVTRVALRGNATLPYEVGPKPILVAICEPEQVDLALSNGAAYAGMDSILDRISGGWTNFDVCVCTTLHMPKLMKVARVLGPRKLMPNLKSGTLASNLMDAIRKLSNSKTVQYRAEMVYGSEWSQLLVNAPIIAKQNLDINQVGMVQVPISLMPAHVSQAIANSQFFIKELSRNRPTVTTKANVAEFHWPPRRKFVNELLQESFSNETESEEASNFIIATAFAIKGPNNVSQVLHVNPNSLA